MNHEILCQIVGFSRKLGEHQVFPLTADLRNEVDQLKSLTFVKTNMQKCLCTFAPFPSRPYFEPCALQSGTSNRDSTVSRFHGRDSDRRRIRVGEDCTSVMDMIREVDPEDASREVSKAT